jgi:hypothetical protein
MSFNFNSRALSTDTARESQGWEELPDDYKPIDVARGTSLLSQHPMDDEIAAASDSEDEVESNSWEAEDAEESQQAEQRLLDEEKAELEMQDEHVWTEEERIQAFVEKYVSLNHITRGYRFLPARESALQTAIMEASLTVQIVDMKKRIKEYVTASAEQVPPLGAAQE